MKGEQTMNIQQKLNLVSPQAKKLYEQIVSAYGNQKVCRHFQFIDSSCFVFSRYDEIMSEISKTTSCLNELVLVELFVTYKVGKVSIQQIDFIIEK